MKIQIICRGSSLHGLGHLFRTRTFAKAIQGLATVEVVAIIEKNLDDIFFEIKHRVKICRTDEEILPVVEKFAPDILIFDLTVISDDIFNKLKEIPRLTASISPVFNRKDKIDILFTRSKYTEKIKNVIIYGGLEYSIFNEYCTRIPAAQYKKNLNKPHLPVAISMGGTDSPNKTLQIIKALSNFPHGLTMWVALGEGYAHSYNLLVNAVNKVKHHEIILAKANKSTWDILGNSVLAILAGGLTTIESVYAGLPTINIYEKEIHLKTTSKELLDIGVTLNAHIFSEKTVQKIPEYIEDLYFNREKLQTMRDKTKGVVDKKGALRVFKILKRHFYYGSSNK